MKISYKISETDYGKLLLLTMRRAERTPGRLAAFVLLTIGQMAWVGSTLAVSGLGTREKTLLVCCSAALALMNALYRALRPVRARRSLKTLTSSGQIVPDYWKTHNLSISDGNVRLSFGSVRLELLCGDIRTEENSGLLLLHGGGKFFDVIPLSAFRSEAEKASLRRALETPCAREAEALPDKAEFTLSWSCSGGVYVKTQVSCYRRVFFSGNYKKVIPLLKLGAGAYFLYYAYSRAGAFTGILLVLLTLLINLTELLTATPAARSYLLRQAPQLDVPSDRSVVQTIAVTSSVLVLTVDGVPRSASIGDISYCKLTRNGAFVYADRWPAVCVPLSAFSGREEAQRFISYINGRVRLTPQT